MSTGEPGGIPLTDPVFAVFAALLGAITGSFLNVVIYRLPRNLSVNNPRRSFCPACKTQIPWHQNLPVLSWVLLRGKCAKCGSPIPVRYALVEALTAALFFGLWRAAGGDPLLALGLFVFCGIAIAAAFIDLEHMIIPDSLTLGGAVAGLVFSVLAPALQGTTDRIEAAGWSILGALAGGLLLWGVVEAGKLAFGRVRVSANDPDDPPLFELERGEDGKPVLVLDGERHVLEETFSRESDRIRIQAVRAALNGRSFSPALIKIAWDRVETPDGALPLGAVTELRGAFKEAVLPREAMGLGDVKFMAAIGAFFGWQAVLFSLVAGSVAGAVAGVAILAARRRGGGGGAAIPFGPYLALGAMIWAFAGPAIVAWYLDTLRPPLPY